MSMDNPAIGNINGLRETLSDCIEDVRVVAEHVKAPAVQEVILAQRHLEDARMRLGLARTYAQGKDPFGRE